MKKRSSLKNRCSLLLVFALMFGLFGGCGRTDRLKAAIEQDGALSASPTPSVSVNPSPEAPEASPTPKEPVDLTEGVILGRSVFIHETNVVFWCAEETLCTSLIDASGQLYDHYAEQEFPTRLWSVAVMGDHCVLGTSDGLFRFSLTEFNAGTVALEKLTTRGVYDGFSIYNGNIYYLKDGELMTVPLSGGTETQVTSDISDYILTNIGIYYTAETGGLCFMGFDGSQRVKLTDTPQEAHLCLQGNGILYWSAGENALGRWNLESGTPEAVSVTRTLAEEEDLWPVGEDAFIYTDSGDDVYLYTLSDGSERLLDSLSVLPEKGKGCLYKDVLYYCYSDTVYWDDLMTLQSGSADLSNFTSSSTSSATPEPAAPAAPSQSQSSSAYDISSNLTVRASQGLAILSNDYFTLTLPMDPSWEVEVINEATLKFTCPDAATPPDYGDGQFLTIRAYDWGDNSYADLPSYQMAGQDEFKKYVAIFPTDVQFDYRDDSKAAMYQTLLDAAKQIDCNANPVGNPFSINQ